MTIRYKCECGAALDIRDEKAGTKGHCPKCKVEFVVPTPGAVAAGAVETSRSAAPVGAARTPSEDLSDDEIEKILEAKDEQGVAARSAPLPRRDAGYGTAVDEPDDDDDDVGYDDDEPPMGIPPRDGGRSDEAGVDVEEAPRRKPRRTAEPAPAPDSAASASIAQDLMAKGGRGVSMDRPEKKGGRPFGGEDRRGEDDERFSIKEVVSYLARVALPATFGIGVGVGLYIWWWSSFSRGDLPPLVPVSGVVTLDGNPLPKAQIIFYPAQTDPGKMNLKVSSSVAVSDSQGRYTLTYVNNVPGAVAGKHRVQVSALNEMGIQLVPPIYNARSRLDVDVPAEGTKDLRLDLSSKAEDTSGTRGGYVLPQ